MSEDSETYRKRAPYGSGKLASAARLAGAEAAKNARRELLLSTIRRNDWSIAKTAAELEMHQSNVIRELKRLAPSEYAAAQAARRIEQESARDRTPSASRAKSGRPTSILTEEGNRAKNEAMRALLLKTLDASDWNLSRAARALEMGNASAILRVLHELAPEEYAAARQDGRVRHRKA